jgi:hypothetical protein
MTEPGLGFNTVERQLGCHLVQNRSRDHSKTRQTSEIDGNLLFHMVIFDRVGLIQHFKSIYS